MTDDEGLDDIVARLDGWATLRDRLDRLWRGSRQDVDEEALKAKRERDMADYREHLKAKQAAEESIKESIEEEKKRREEEMSDEEIERAKAEEAQAWDGWAHSPSGISSRRRGP